MEKPLVLQILFGVISLLSFGGNGLFCFVITRHHRVLLRSPYHILIFSLAITDMLTGKLTVLLYKSRLKCQFDFIWKMALRDPVS